MHAGGRETKVSVTDAMYIAARNDLRRAIEVCVDTPNRADELVDSCMVSFRQAILREVTCEVRSLIAQAIDDATRVAEEEK